MDCGAVDPILNGLVTFKQARDAKKACATGLMGVLRVGFVIEIKVVAWKLLLRIISAGYVMSN